MCKYCDMKNYNSIDTDKKLKKGRFDLGCLGYLEHNLVMTYLSEENAKIVESPRWTLASEVWHPILEYSDSLQVHRIPIKYCPFCGRELES